MKCGTCQQTMKNVTAWRDHKRETGCHWHRPVWVKVLAAKRRGSSGRRLLSDAYPHLYKRTPMTEEAKERLRQLNEKRVKVSKRDVQKVRRRRAV